MSKSVWIKEKDSNKEIVWRSKIENNFTIEARDLEEATLDSSDAGKWYVYPARNKNAIFNTPFIVGGKQEAISKIADLKIDFNNGVFG